MNKLIVSLLFSLSSESAFADKYGIHESMSEGEASWGGAIIALIILAYVHFKGK